MNENRSVFALDGVTGMLIATVLLLSILAGLSVWAIGVQQAEASNFYKIENEKLPVELFDVPETLQIQEKKIKKIKKERNSLQAQRALDDIARCCDEDKNLMEVIVDSVKAYITEGEISKTLKMSYGTWNPPVF